MTEPTAANPAQTRGLDVSHFQGTVDWNQVVQAGYAFAFIKATDGITYVDPMFATNWSGAKAAGLLRGAYHFFEADDDPQQQAENFLKTVTLESGDLPPVLDVESSSTSSQVSTATVIDRVAAWLQAVQQATGRTPILYTDNSYWDSLGTKQFSGYPLWIADYGVASPTLPTGWTSWAFWQFSQSGEIPGIATAVDLNLFQGGLEDLVRLVSPIAKA
ncbi:MAG TPA: glycoside hydrolase family 25 protein [Thermoanaerobaculia bacterium]|jgi:lysozyme|nr:glycoside hydrolase family 25 protein [Thermoanaerobaculia bacterium]